MDGQISYLNTDLDLSSSRDLTELAKALESHSVFSLHVTCCDDGSWIATFETEEQQLEPEQSISIMLSAIESLPSNLYDIWSRCSRRDFNIGYDCGDEPWEFNQALSNDLLSRLANVGGSLRITLYPDRPQHKGDISK